MAKSTPTKVEEPEYADYLDKEPTQLMDHILDWLLEKTGLDVTKDCETKEDAFALGVQLTVALRPAHQASPENQQRLDNNRLLKEEEQAEKAEKRAEREASRQEKAAVTEATPKRGRGRPKATETAEVAESDTAAPRRGRGRPKAAAKAETATAEVTPIRGRRSKRGAPQGAEEPAVESDADAEAEPPPAARRSGRRPAVRKGEAAF